MRHPMLTVRGYVLAGHFFQKVLLLFSPVFLITHKVLSELPTLLALLNRPIRHIYALPVSLCEIFGVQTLLFDRFEDMEL